jgi:two-component system KDP operon response regulator KdpE
MRSGKLGQILYNLSSGTKRNRNQGNDAHLAHTSGSVITERKMDGKRILIIDDDPYMRQLLETIFVESGAEIVSARDGAEGLRLLYHHRPDLVVLDIKMPGKSGWEVCTQIREMSTVPIIMLTSLNSDDDVVRALESGAVDYVTKPFSNKVLLARARAALRQAASQAPDSRRVTSYRDEYLTVDLAQRRVLADGEPVHLTKTEFELLATLIRHAGSVLTFDQILEQVWGPGYEDSPDYVHGYTSRLRHKLEPDPREPRYLMSEHGVGYRFQPQE